MLTIGKCDTCVLRNQEYIWRVLLESVHDFYHKDYLESHCESSSSPGYQLVTPQFRWYISLSWFKFFTCLQSKLHVCEDVGRHWQRRFVFFCFILKEHWCRQRCFLSSVASFLLGSLTRYHHRCCCRRPMWSTLNCGNRWAVCRTRD